MKHIIFLILYKCAQTTIFSDMDGLSAASSIFAVVSLAIQLGTGFNKLRSPSPSLF
jgi:hypothetical protein